MELQGNLIDARQARIKVLQLDDMINVMRIQLQEEVAARYIPIFKVLPSPYREAKKQHEEESWQTPAAPLLRAAIEWSTCIHNSTQETVERLKAAIESLKAKGQAITTQNIYAECGLHYSTYVRNEEAIALFRANSTHLTQKKKQTKWKRTTDDDTPPPSRDPLMHYKKPQLITRLREAESTILRLEQQLGHVAHEYLERDARIVQLEAKLTELEPYRTFVEQVRQRVRYEEHGSDTPYSS